MEPLESRLHLNHPSSIAVPPLNSSAIGSRITAAANDPHSSGTIATWKVSPAVAVSDIAVAAPRLTLIPDPKKHIIISANPASPGEGGIVTIRAITNNLGPLSGDRLLVAWGDGRLSDLAGDGASFGTYDTGDPLTKGITVTHTYLRGGTYDPYLNTTNDNGDSAFAQFGFPDTLFLPGVIPTITSPVELRFLSGATAHLHVAGIASDGSEAVYDWQIVGQPKNALPAEFVAPDFNTTASPRVHFTQPGDYTFQVSIVARYGSLYATAFLKVHVVQQPTSIFIWPARANVPPKGSYQLRATVLDQFGYPMRHPPRIQWFVASSIHGTITPNGRYRATGEIGAVDTVHAVARDPQSGYVSASLPVNTGPTATQPNHAPASVTHANVEEDDNGNIMLTWSPGDTTADGFVVESSYDQIHFTPIGRIPAGQDAFLADNLTATDYTYNFRITPFNAIGAGKTTTTKLALAGSPGFVNPDISGGIAGRSGHLDTVAFTNKTGMPIPAGYTAEIFASLDNTLDSAIRLGKAVATLPLAVGASAYFSIQTTLPKDMLAGAYRLLAAIVEPGGDPMLVVGEIASFIVRPHSTSGASLSRPRASVSTLAIGSTAIFAGGDTPDGSSQLVDLYDTHTRHWSTTTLPHVSGDLASATLDGKALFTDGALEDSGHVLVDILDTHTGRWSSKPLPLSSGNIGAASIGDTVMFVGTDGTAAIYSGSTGRFSASTLPSAFASPSSVIVTATVCGQALFTDGNIAQIYNGLTGHWSEISLPDTFGFANAVTIGTKVFFPSSTGGKNNDSVAVLVVYDGLTGQTSVLPTPEPGTFDRAVAAGDNLLLFANTTAPNPDTGRDGFIAEVLAYNVDTGAWKSRAKLVTRNLIGAVTVGTHSFFAGGQQDSGFQSPVLDNIDILNDPNPSPALDGTLIGQPGGTMTATVRNTGDADLPAGATVSIYSSVDRTLHTDSTLLGLVRLQKSLKSGTSTRIKVNTTIPQMDLPPDGSVLAAIGTSGSLKTIGVLGDVVRGRPSFSAAQWTSTTKAGPTGVDFHDHFKVVGELAIAATYKAAAIQYNSVTDEIAEIPVPHVVAGTTAVAGTKVLFHGYSSENNPYNGTSAVDIFDTATGQWTSAMLSAPRLLITTGTIGHKAFFAGGVKSISLGGYGPASDVIDIYDADTGQWTTADLARHLYNGFMHVPLIVGENAIFTTTQRLVLDIYNATTGLMTHIPLPTLPTTPSFLVSDYFTEEVVAGGMAVFSDGNTLAIYDPTTNEWSTVTAPRIRQAAAVTAIGDLIAFAGGSIVDDAGHATPTQSVDLYNVRTGIWSTTTSPATIGNLTPATLGSRMIFTGSALPFERSVGSIQIFDTATREWSAAPVDLTGNLLVVGGKLLIEPSNIYNVRQDQIIILTPGAIAPPATPSPMPGGIVNRSALFSWSAVDGATRYDVYLDESLVATVSTDHWMPTSTITPGAHTWRITAKIGAAFLAGPLWNFSI